ncbi:MAG TPA: PIN domain nuclease [Bacteroidales bacterium]|nr:MAG: twitching motility protein PilT [Bacteroidetes bacterium GWE2_42_24]OFY26053.1 MAG: twitching motility protein PilT [Bacteroidetes bacterium GWF2_43_11]HBZ65359.1 PIN domain nuclease [Bacteroidales bacterium]
MIPKLFIDTNIMLDLLGERVPYYESIARVATLADKGKIKMVVSAFSYPTVYYLLRKFESSEKVKEKLRKFRIISEVSALDEITIEKGLASDFIDFEDALQYHCALKADCNILLTRNAKDFKESTIPVMSADEFLQSIKIK